MKRLNFLAGKWAGEARLLRGPGQWVSVLQTEEAQYKLDRLILVIEGVGRAKTDSKPMLQALGVISYNDESATYRIRAFNDGRFLESEVKLLSDGKGITWEFSLGQIRTASILGITDKGDWTELADSVRLTAVTEGDGTHDQPAEVGSPVLGRSDSDCLRTTTKPSQTAFGPEWILRRVPWRKRSG